MKGDRQVAMRAKRWANLGYRCCPREARLCRGFSYPLHWNRHRHHGLPAALRSTSAVTGAAAAGRMEVLLHDDSLIGDALLIGQGNPRDGNGGVRDNVAVVVANSPSLPRDLLAGLWSLAKLKACADGGANRLFDLYHENKGQSEQGDCLVPDLIVGDLDSLRANVSSYFEKRGTDIRARPDQNRHDLDKTISEVLEFGSKDVSPVTIIVVGGLGGRLDHTMGNLNMLYRWSDDKRLGRLILLCEHSLAYLLPANRTNKIHVDSRITSGTCGLIPLGCTADEVSTIGLKWNLNENALEFGGLVSSSNQVAKKTGNTSLAAESCRDVFQLVQVTSSKPLLWTIELDRI